VLTKLCPDLKFFNKVGLALVLLLKLIDLGGEVVDFSLECPLLRSEIV